MISSNMKTYKMKFNEKAGTKYSLKEEELILREETDVEAMPTFILTQKGVANMPIIDGYMCKGYIEKEDGKMICIEDDMSAGEQRKLFRCIRNKFADSLLEIMYEKEKECKIGEKVAEMR